MDDSKTNQGPVILKRSRLGPNLKAVKTTPKPSPVIPNGNGVSTSDEKPEAAPEASSVTSEKDKASMSVRNKEICRLHMEETNSINNAQNSDATADKNKSSDPSESNKVVSDLKVSKEESVPFLEETNSVSTTEKSEEPNGSDVSDGIAISSVSKVDSSAPSDESTKTGEKNGQPEPKIEACDIKVEKPSDDESVKVEASEDPSKLDTPKSKVVKKEPAEVSEESPVKTEVSEPAKEPAKPEGLRRGRAAAKAEVLKPVSESKVQASKFVKESTKVDVSKPAKESTKAEALKTVKESEKADLSKPVKETGKGRSSRNKEPAKPEVVKPGKDSAKTDRKVKPGEEVAKDSVQADEKPVKEVSTKAEVTKSGKDSPSKTKGKKPGAESSQQSTRSSRGAPKRTKSQEEEAHSSGSEEFHGFDIEHTEKSIKAKKRFIEASEENEVSSSAVPNTPLSEDSLKSALSKRMRKNIVDISDPRYLKPFEFGWKRELVYRATNEDGKRQGDIYYYTPNGKKVRSQREVSEHITDPELSPDNFTFSKEPLGLNDPEKEIIRDARMRMSKDFAVSPFAKTTVKTPKAKATLTPVATATPKSAASTPKTTPKVVIKTPAASSGGLKVKFTGIKSGSTAAKSSATKSKPAKVKKRKSSGGSSELEMGMLPPSWSSPDAKSESVTTARSWSPPTVSESTKEETDRSCSIYCRQAMGIIPSLQCHACQCLFHPECCGISPGRTILQYICKKCQKNWNWKTRTMASPTKTGNCLTVSLPAPKSTLVSLSSSVPPKTIATSTVTKTAKITNIVGGVTTWLPPSSTIQFSSSTTTVNSPKSNPPSATRSDDTVTSPPTQAVVEMNGKRFIVMPKQNVVSVSQPTPISSLDSNPPPPVPVTAIQCFPRPQLVLSPSTGANSESLALAPISTPNLVAGGAFLPRSSPGLTPGTFLMSTHSTNPPGVLLVPCLPQQTALGGSAAVQPQYVLVNGAGVGGNLVFANSLLQSSEDKENVVGKKRSADKSEDKKSPPSKRVKVETDVEESSQGTVSSAPVVTTTTPSSGLALVKPSHYFMMNLAAGYSTLMHIFRYLNLKELLVASRVCRLWNDVASKQHFWQTVRMKNTQVSDWNGFAEALIKHETKHLDLRKMLVGTKTEEVKNTWQEFYKVIGQVKSLKRIELCRCLSSVIEGLAKHVPHIESLTATSIKNTSLNLEPLSAITNLTELRLKGMSGIELTFNHLSNLKSLKLLSITGIKNLDNESSKSIGSLENLETLEIGDCNNMHQETVTEAIPKLVNLKRLRLEKGQNSVPLIIQLIESASKLPQLEILELINFDVKPGFEDALKKCTNVKSLLMIPTYITQSATTNHIVMVGVSNLKHTLKHFVWGLTLELLRVTDLFIDQCETTKTSPAQSPNSNSVKQSKGKGDSIPILKPLIDTLEEGKDLKEPLQITSSGPSKVDILPIPKLRKVLSSILPTTDIRILKIPFNQTWRQTLL